ncbi:hypothetical protein CURTO8I2_140049 [Curtobacterium sp. 8I-2]|nr:hypothetical protein CURTO8I2_140049 [Curtobacterium sp. 8I-2]
MHRRRLVIDAACLLCHPCPFRRWSERMGRTTYEIQRCLPCGEGDVLHKAADLDWLGVDPQ